MAKTRYSKNPITEAVIDIQFESGNQPGAEAFKSFEQQLEGKFPTRRERHLIETKFNFDVNQKKPVQTQNVMNDGFDFWAADKRQVIQARKNGYAFARLKPYDVWESHFPEALKYLEQYQTVFGMSSARRLAVRFINVVNIPKVEIDIPDYFNCGPNTPPGISDKISSFLYRVVILLGDNTKANVNISPGPAASDSLNIILDIDVFADYQSPISGEYTKIFDILHEHAESIFEAYITDKVRELIK